MHGGSIAASRALLLSESYLVARFVARKKQGLSRKQFLATPRGCFTKIRRKRNSAWPCGVHLYQYVCVLCAADPRVSNMIKNEVAAHGEQINTFHYRNPANGGMLFPRIMSREMLRHYRGYFHPAASRSIGLFNETALTLVVTGQPCVSIARLVERRVGYFLEITSYPNLSVTVAS